LERIFLPYKLPSVETENKVRFCPAGDREMNFSTKKGPGRQKNTPARYCAGQILLISILTLAVALYRC
jgi:hypothetical protein